MKKIFYIILGILMGTALPTYALSTFVISQGGTGASSFPSNSILVTGNTGTSALVASSSPTVNSITATSTTATSTFSDGINATGGCFALNGTCLTQNAGSVSSITLGGGLDGLSPITTTGTIISQISTSSAPVIGNLPYWTGNGTPSSLGTIATTTVSLTGLDGGISGFTIGGSNGTIISQIGTGTVPTSGQIPYWGTIGTPSQLLSIATSSAACSGGITCSGFTVVGSVSPSISISAPVSIANGGTNNTTTYTSGSVIFSNGTSLIQNNNNFFWDNTNIRLGIGSTTPSAGLSASPINGTPSFIVSTSTSGANNSTSTAFLIDKNGLIGIGLNLPAQTLDVLGTIQASQYYYQKGNLVLNTLNGGTTDTYLGRLAGNTTGTGANNAFFGYQAGQSIAAGGTNTGIGNGSDFALTSGSDNTAIGNNSLLTLTTGSQNTAIGSAADINSNNLTNTTVIGYNTKANNSNSVVIGNGSVTTFGIATATPGSLFSVNGITNFTTATSSMYGTGGINLTGGGCFAVSSTCIGAAGASGTVLSGTTGQFPYYASNGTTLTATSTLFLTTASNVGIGTTTPNWLLQEAGTRPLFVLSDTGAGTNLKHWFESSQGGNFYIGTSSDAYSTSTIPNIFISSNGQVGINESVVTSGYSFEVTGQSQILKAGTGLTVQPNSGNFNGITASGSLSDMAYVVTNSGTGGRSYALTSGNNTSALGTGNFNIYDVTGSATRLSITSTGLVGINTNVPKSQFDVSGGVGIGLYAGVTAAPGNTLIVSNGIGSGTTTPGAYLSVAPLNGSIPFLVSTSTSGASNSTSTAFLIDKNGLVGIGTSTPPQQLSIAGNEYVSGNLGIGSSTPSTGLTVANANITLNKSQFASYWASTTISSGLITPNFNSGNMQRFLLNGATTLNLDATSTNANDGANVLLKICNDIAGSRILTFGAAQANRFIGITPATSTMPTAGNSCLLLGATFDQSANMWQIASTTGVWK